MLPLRLANSLQFAYSLASGEILEAILWRTLTVLVLTVDGYR